MKLQALLRAHAAAIANLPLDELMAAAYEDIPPELRWKSLNELGDARVRYWRLVRAAMALRGELLGLVRAELNGAAEAMGLADDEVAELGTPVDEAGLGAAADSVPPGEVREVRAFGLGNPAPPVRAGASPAPSADEARR